MIRYAAVRIRLLIAHGIAAVLLSGVVGFAVWRLTAFPPDPVGAAGLAAGAAGLVLLPAVIYRIVLLLSAHYEITSKGGLIVNFGSRREVIPVDEIEEIRSGQMIPDAVRQAAPGWLDAWQGRVEVSGGEAVEWLATDRGPRLLLLLTKQRRLAVSPDDPAGFARRLTDLTAQTSLEKIEPLSVHPEPMLRDIINTPPAIGILGAGWAGIVALAAFLFGMQPVLPGDQPFRFDPSGLPASPGSPLRLMILPLVGGGIWLLNAFIGWRAWRKGQQPAAYALWIVSLTVAIGLWAASLLLLNAD
jgi:hypothetical protein